MTTNNGQDEELASAPRSTSVAALTFDVVDPTLVTDEFDDVDKAKSRLMTSMILLGAPLYVVLAGAFASIFDAPLTDHPHLSPTPFSAYVFAVLILASIPAPFVAAALSWRVLKETAQRRQVAWTWLVIAALEILSLPLPISFALYSID